MKVEKILFQGKSEYQNVMVFKVLDVLELKTCSLPPVFSYYEWSVSDFYVAVFNLWKCSCFGWCDSTHREG